MGAGADGGFGGRGVCSWRHNGVDRGGIREVTAGLGSQGHIAYCSCGILFGRYTAWSSDRLAGYVAGSTYCTESKF